MPHFNTIQVITVSDWDDLIMSTYGKKYSFQQQDDCKSRGMFYFTVPYDDNYDYPRQTVPEVINGEMMGVSFDAWIARDPKTWHGDPKDKTFLDMFWERNFYPHVSTLINDLYQKGILKSGDYAIDIDW